jgi:hypothetical protein
MAIMSMTIFELTWERCEDGTTITAAINLIPYKLRDVANLPFMRKKFNSRYSI